MKFDDSKKNTLTKFSSSSLQMLFGTIPPLYHYLVTLTQSSGFELQGREKEDHSRPRGEGESITLGHFKIESNFNFNSLG